MPVEVTEGLFIVLLGQINLPNMTPIPAHVFTNGGVHLRLWFNDGTQGFVQLSPDLPVASVGYALVPAGVLNESATKGAPTQSRGAAMNTGGLINGSVTTPKIADGAVTSEKIADGTIELPDLSPGTRAGKEQG